MKKFHINSALIFAFFLFILGCQDEGSYEVSTKEDKRWLHSSIKKITDILVYDITNPPLASRSYAYPCLAAYHAYIPFAKNNEPITDQLNGWQGEPISIDTQLIDGEFASISALLETSRNHIYSQDQLQEWIDSVYSFYSSRLPEDIFKATKNYGTSIAEQIKQYSGTDGLKEIRTMAKFQFDKAETGNWIPTPPNYMDPIEPNWRELRPFCLDSASQFKPVSPTPFSMAEDSKFYKELKEVYDIGKNISQEQKEIASFWDCNPYVVLHHGHFMQPYKKITPGGHWMGITRLACISSEANFEKSLKAYSFTSIALADAFIACWDEKYRSNYIRPETVINIHLDKSWTPLLQTPPFPEYTSGHSVISTAAARTLTHLFGDGFEFLDTVEKEFGLPERKFSSFLEASKEAAVSRIYGGIHFRPAVDEGIKQGNNVADKVLSTLSK